MTDSNGSSRTSQGTLKSGSEERSSLKSGSEERASLKSGSEDRGSLKRASENRGSLKRASDERASEEIPFVSYRKNRKRHHRKRDKKFKEILTKDAIINHTKVLASLLPDELIYDLDDHSIRKYNVALLLGDVSGFTDLCEKYNKTGMGGPARLTEILNGFIGSMVQEILSANGDVLKFSGDAFLVWWKSSPEKSMQDVVNQAVECSINIQKHYGRKVTDVKVVLKVKLAVAAGQVFFSLIGDGKMNHYITVGQPIFDVKLAESFATAGDVMVSPTAWQYINIHDYEHSFMPDQEHIKVTGFAPWKPMQVAPTYQDEFSGQANSARDVDSAEDISYQPERGRGSDVSYTNRAEEFSLRPSVNVIKRMEPIRPYIFPPVMIGVDMDEPIEYLTEMRHVVIMFVNVIPKKDDMERLVSTADQAYQKVCRLVVDNKGCVNKASMFDKDLMFLIIFGLRGYKHDLECQSGLHCAAEVYQALTEMDDIISVSIGVTTGITYCGVVGHVLRREYTVIGIPVNKAARLMMAYAGKVTCDRETQVHSTLDFKHFTLQEPKKLKGLDQVGPIYQYKDATCERMDKHVVSRLPLLGRDAELLLFTTFVERLVAQYNKRDAPPEPPPEDPERRRYVIPPVNVLLISGELREGKSRLLDEMIYSTNREVVSVHRIALSHHDKRAPYRCIQLIFHPTLGLTELSTIKEREDRLTRALEGLQMPQLLCSLNTIFNVGFDISHQYLQYNDVQRTEIMNTVFKKLIHKCFKTVWVIGIDDCEFIDEDSWLLMPHLFEANYLFLVMVLGQRRDISDLAEKVSGHKRVRHAPLHEIDKAYHAGLVCQMMDVRAIPPELEKEVQERSMGKPGWFESFLVNLIQMGGVTTDTVAQHTITKLGLVVPPIEMMVRGYHLDDVLKAHDPQQVVQVCKLTPHFRLSDVKVELAKHDVEMKIFDSLKFYEKNLLKCASVLGESFPRKMVQALMPNPDNRQTALAVKHMFDIHVLGCAEGDFNQTTNTMPFQQRLVNPGNNVGLYCTCKGIEIEESCKDLPDYASCGFMRFHMTVFRDMAYNLLTNVQKKEAHLRAIKYLERETVRCNSCGGGPFHNILGNKYSPEDDERVSVTNAQRKSLTGEYTSLIDGRGSAEQPETSYGFGGKGLRSGGARSVAQLKQQEQWFAKYTDMDPDESTGAEARANALSGREPHIRCCGTATKASGLIFDSSRSGTSLTRSFSTINFTNCQCQLILSTMYAQMLDHCHGSGDVITLMDVLLEYAAVSIAAANIPQANRLLDEALNQLETKTLQLTQEEDYDAIPDWQAPFIKGKIYTLMGSAQLVLGQMDTAYKRLYLAMVEFGNPFPTQAFKVKFACKYQLVKLKLILHYFPQVYIGHTKGLKATMAEHMSVCLALLFALFKIQQQWESAKLAAVWGLNLALQTNRDFFGLATSYTNMMEVAHHFGYADVSLRLENSSNKVCSRIIAVEEQELEAITRLYFAVFLSRVNRGELEHGAKLAFSTLHMACSIHSVHLRLRILPKLIRILLHLNRLDEVASLLEELRYAAQDDTDNSAMTWYFAIGLGIQLDSGYCVVPFRQCEKFYQEVGETLNTIRDPNSSARFFVNLWLWCVRLEEWDESALWEHHTRKEYPTLYSSTNSAIVMTFLRVLEALLITLVGKAERWNVRALTEKHKEIIGFMSHLKKYTKRYRVAIPRFLHLKAYYRQAVYKDSKALRILMEAKQIAQKQQNLLEVAWIEHNEKVWRGLIPPILQGHWKEHCDPDNFLDWHEADSNAKMAVYTLPMTSHNLKV